MLYLTFICLYALIDYCFVINFIRLYKSITPSSIKSKKRRFLLYFPCHLTFIGIIFSTQTWCCKHLGWWMLNNVIFLLSFCEALKSHEHRFLVVEGAAHVFKCVSYLIFTLRGWHLNILCVIYPTIVWALLFIVRQLAVEPP